MAAKELAISEAEEQSINQWFPHIQQIKNDDIKQKVIKVWVRIWRQSGYKDLSEAQTVPSEEHLDLSLVTHTNAVTEAALTVASQFQKQHNIPINFDVLLAAAILHDIDKPVIFEVKSNVVERSELGKKIPHGIYGAHVALEEGLPLEIAHVICTHSQYCTLKPSTVEGTIIYHLDMANARCLRAAQGNQG